MIYLDNAATTSPKPQSVIKAVGYAMNNLSANPGRSGHRASQNAAMTVYRTREKAAEMFGLSKPENVVFTLNCTHALNFVIKGCLRPGDHVIISSLEHNAVMRPVMKMMKNGVKVDVAEVIIGDANATMRSFMRLMRSDTKMVITTQISNVCGARIPIERIGQVCREKGIIFVVDAAQSAGVLPIDMEKMCIDHLCIAAHKGLYAPMGTGMLLSTRNISDTIIEGGTGTASISMIQPDDMPERFESGTINVPGIAGLSAGMDFVRSKGLQNIYQHEMKLICKSYNELKRIKHIKLYTEYPDENFGPVLSFNIGEMNSIEGSEQLAKFNIATRAGLHCAPTAHKRLGTIDQGTIRICPSVFTTENDIDRLIFAVRRISGNAKSIFY